MFPRYSSRTPSPGSTATTSPPAAGSPATSTHVERSTKSVGAGIGGTSAAPSSAPSADRTTSRAGGDGFAPTLETRTLRVEPLRSQS